MTNIEQLRADIEVAKRDLAALRAENEKLRILARTAVDNLRLGGTARDLRECGTKLTNDLDSIVRPI